MEDWVKKSFWPWEAWVENNSKMADELHGRTSRNTRRIFVVLWWTGDPKRMLTPVFELSQDDDFVVVIVKTPYVKVSFKFCVKVASCTVVQTSGPVFIQHFHYKNFFFFFLLYSFINLQIADVDFCINSTEFKFYVKPYFLRWAGDTFYIKLEFWKECCFLRYAEIKSLQAEITS